VDGSVVSSDVVRGDQRSPRTILIYYDVLSKNIKFHYTDIL
jgi:hypothetical protein